MIKPFVPRRMLIPVLPTVYDDALSYMEFCGKIADKTNEIIEYVNNLQLEASGWIISPKDYGAVGDGVADDTEALEKCFKSNSLILLNGTYKITRTIRINNKENMTIIGGNIVRPFNQVFSSFIGAYCRNITIIGTHFDGNGNLENDYQWKDNYQCCFVNEHSSNITFMNCIIENYNYGCYIIGATEHIAFEASCGAFINCFFKNNTTGIDTYGKTLTVENCWFQGNGNAIQYEPNYNISDIEDITEGTNYYTCGLGMTVDRCTFIENTEADIRVFKNSYYSKFTNNTHINFRRGVIIQDQIIGALIQGNSFRNCVSTPTEDDRPYHRAFSAVSIGSSNAMVLDNIFDYCNVGVCVETSEKIQIHVERNKFSNSKWTNIAVYDAQVIVNNNAMYGFEISDIWSGSKPIVLAHNTEAIIKDNYIESDVEPIYTDGTCSAYIDNNACTHTQSTTVTTLELYTISNLT